MEVSLPNWKSPKIFHAYRQEIHTGFKSEEEESSNSLEFVYFTGRGDITLILGPLLNFKAEIIAKLLQRTQV